MSLRPGRWRDLPTPSTGRSPDAGRSGTAARWLGFEPLPRRRTGPDFAGQPGATVGHRRRRQGRVTLRSSSGGARSRPRPGGDGVAIHEPHSGCDPRPSSSIVPRSARPSPRDLPVAGWTGLGGPVPSGGAAANGTCADALTQFRRNGPYCDRADDAEPGSDSPQRRAQLADAAPTTSAANMPIDAASARKVCQVRWAKCQPVSAATRSRPPERSRSASSRHRCENMAA